MRIQGGREEKEEVWGWVRAGEDRERIREPQTHTDFS